MGQRVLLVMANEYIRQYNDFYFLTPPDEFIRDHYPEDLQWTLLKDPPVYREFAQSPFRYSGYVKAGVSSYFPAKGVIDVSVGDTVLIELKARKEISNFLFRNRQSLTLHSFQNSPL